MRSKFWVRSAPLSVLTLLVLGACSSSGDRSLKSQAVDGYIARATVFCDAEANGLTAAAGRFKCPKNTVLATVRGGWDVDFDEEAETSNKAFTGELRAPANLGYVTPLSTIAVEMASTEDGGYQSDLWEAKVAALGLALGATGDDALDLKKNPADLVNNKSLIRFNMQIHQIISAFAKSGADYGLAVAAFAKVMTKNADAGLRVDLQGNLEKTLTDLNAELPANSELRKQSGEITSLALLVAANNQAIDAAVTAGNPDEVAAAAIDASISRATVTIDRSAQAVTLTSSTSTFDLSIDDFEDSTLSNGRYMTQVDSGLVEVGYNNEVLQFGSDMDNVQVTMGFELKSTTTGDSRALSFYSDDIRLSATKNQSGSLVISVPEGSTLNAVGTDSMNITTTAQIAVQSSNVFSNANGSFSVNYSTIVDELERLGYDDIFADAAGNYEMTLIIGGIQLKEETAAGVGLATGYEISVGDTEVTGAGFKGYISYLN